MEAPELEADRGRVPFIMVLVPAVGLWLCYFLLQTLRVEFLGFPFEQELFWRRALASFAGIPVTLCLWVMLRAFDHGALWAKITAPLVLSAPFALLLALVNHVAFADLEEEILQSIADEQGVRIRRDESGDLLVEVPAARVHGLSSPGGEEAQGGTITIDRQTQERTKWQGIGEVAFARYFMLLAWSALYLALLAGEKARAAERRGGEFRRAAKAAELRSLRYQVNPHFLFNTLNSLSALVLTGRTGAAERMIQMLATFYRRSLAEDPGADVPLEQELALQELYLAIEAVRFPDRLRVEVDLPPELADARVPGMILQPLVENSVRHAVALSPGKVTISISARMEEGNLLLTVENDGSVVASARDGHPGHGIGLSNVRERLAARFGRVAGLVAGPTSSGYATQIRMPLIRENA